MSSMTITPKVSSTYSRHPVTPTAHRPTARPTPRTEVRLTRRGRVVVFAACLLIVLGAAFVLLGGRSVATDKAGRPEPTTVVMVGYGDTLWDIADDAAADGHTAEMVDRIIRLNALDSGMVVAGQKLRVPTD